jgi:hypothetical protein
MKLFFSLALLVVAFSACKKGVADFTLKGVITDATFNKNLEGASLSFYKVPVGSVQPILVTTLTTGSDGAYSLFFPRESIEKYILRITKDGYFEQEKTIYFSELTTDGENTRNYSTTAKSWVKLRFVHTINPQPTNQLQITIQQGKENCTECCAHGKRDFYGIVDTTIYCINDANTTYSYLYFLLGTSTSGTKSITTPPFDTTEILLEY